MNTSELQDIPRPARMYDYYLGGVHNTEADRKAADQIMAHAPYTGFITRTHRDCLKDVAAELTKRGFDLLIDLASGLPTQENLHYHVPKGTAVVYADIDPFVVEYSREILGDTPDVYYFQADLHYPNQLLDQPDVQRLLNEGRKAAFVTWGIALFLTDDDIASLARTLYDWSAPGTCWACNATLANMNMENENLQQTLAYYQSLNSPMYVRPLERFRELLLPWKPDERDFVSIYDWHNIDLATVREDIRDVLGPGGGGYGAYLIK